MTRDEAMRLARTVGRECYRRWRVSENWEAVDMDSIVDEFLAEPPAPDVQAQIDTAREQLSAREQSATNLAALAADPDNEDLHAAPMMTPDWETRDLLRTYWREHVKDQKQLIYLARVATGADTHGVTELDRRGIEIRDALLRGYEQNEDLCFLDEVRRENERLKAQIDAARAEERERCAEIARLRAVRDAAEAVAAALREHKPRCACTICDLRAALDAAKADGSGKG